MLSALESVSALNFLLLLVFDRLEMDEDGDSIVAFLYCVQLGPCFFQGISSFTYIIITIQNNKQKRTL